MLYLLLWTALGRAAAASQPTSALLSRLSLRTCDEALSPARAGVMRTWFTRHVDGAHVRLHAFEELDEEAMGRRVFAIDETLERLGERPAGAEGRARVDAERWQLELSSDLDEGELPPGLSPTLLGDRLRFDLSTAALTGGEFVVGIHWEPPADPVIVAGLRELVSRVKTRPAFTLATLRLLRSGAADRDELYVVLDDRTDAETRFFQGLRFLSELNYELASLGHQSAEKPR